MLFFLENVMVWIVCDFRMNPTTTEINLLQLICVMLRRREGRLPSRKAASIYGGYNFSIPTSFRKSLTFFVFSTKLWGKDNKKRRKGSFNQEWDLISHQTKSSKHHTEPSERPSYYRARKKTYQVPDKSPVGPQTDTTRAKKTLLEKTSANH